MDLEVVKMCLRSVLLSEKNGIPLRRLESSYKDLIGEDINFRNFGHNKLQEFLKSISDTVQFKSVNNELYVQSVANEETAHIEDLLRGQMRSKIIRSTNFSNQRQLQRPKQKPVFNRRSFVKTDDRKLNLNTKLKSPYSVAINGKNDSNNNNNNFNDVNSGPNGHKKDIIRQSTNLLNFTRHKMDYKKLLNDLALENNWEKPVYKSHGYDDKASKKFVYLGKVTVNNSSIPCVDTFLTASDAEEAAAKLAYEELKNKTVVTDCKQITEKDDIIKKLISILSEDNLKSWFDSGLADEYLNRFKENLPSNWIQMIKDSNGLIEVEECNYSNVTKTMIALPNPKSKKRTPAPGVTTRSVQTPHADDSSSNISEDVINGGKAIPKPVLPPVIPNPKDSDGFVDVVVLLPASPHNFVVIPFVNLNPDSEFNAMKRRMFEFYEKEENKFELPQNVITKGLYVAGKYHDNWHRIQVKAITPKPFEVICLLVDYGEHQTFELKDIQPLYNEFRDLPMQAMKASLATADPINNDFWDVMACIVFRKMVENKAFVATVYDIKEVESEPVLQISLCDTSGADDVYIGQQLVERGFAKQRISYI